MGNEYHSICCGLSGIMYAIELVKGKDHPKNDQMPNTMTRGNQPVYCCVSASLSLERVSFLSLTMASVSSKQL
jgi:hypothetical protein